METINYGEWIGNIDQIKRIVSSREKKLQKGIMEIDTNAGTAVIKGSGSEPYYVTLSTCTCMDFALHGLPCKHMYALADKMGFLADFPVYKGGFDKHAQVEQFKEKFMSGDLDADTFVKLAKALGA